MELKRIFDLLCSLIFLIILSPLFIFISLFIYFNDFSSVFYIGVRIGKDGVPFNMYKFRSMVVGAERMGPSSTTINDQRQTRIGKILRKYKLDELPQLINVFLGQMSFVGPRPQVEWAVQGYSEEEKKVLSVRPGITDLASIKFHNEGELLEGSDDPDKYYLEKIHPEKMRITIDYVQNRNMLLDLKIILLTIKKIIIK